MTEAKKAEVKKQETKKAEKPVTQERSDQRSGAQRSEASLAAKTSGSQSSKGTFRRSRADDNVVFVGKKPTMSYVMAVITQFNNDQTEVHVKSRGRSISRAVDVAEAVRNKFMKDLKSTVNVSTDEITDNEGRRLNISVIDIKLAK
ncbi:MAG: DNA-binding protein Alba [Candidatus Aenigmarchaeota archaeon]|nr:DNA-binding protein Alba [Candidatus Aenigmarchaeota archaeon]